MIDFPYEIIPGQKVSFEEVNGNFNAIKTHTQDIRHDSIEDSAIDFRHTYGGWKDDNAYGDYSTVITNPTAGQVLLGGTVNTLGKGDSVLLIRASLIAYVSVAGSGDGVATPSIYIDGGSVCTAPFRIPAGSAAAGYEQKITVRLFHVIETPSTPPLIQLRQVNSGAGVNIKFEDFRLEVTEFIA